MNGKKARAIRKALEINFKEAKQLFYKGGEGRDKLNAINPAKALYRLCKKSNNKS